MKMKISKHANDIIQKYVNGIFRDATLEFYGLNTSKIKELVNIELPVVEVGDSRTDIVFLLEDNSYLHFEFQSTYNKSDLARFAHYDLRLYTRDGRTVTTVIIYPAGIETTETELTVGSLQYHPGKIMMAQYDGSAIFAQLEAKIKERKSLSDADMMNLIFLPLMKNDVPMAGTAREELAVKSIKLAQTVEDATKRDACIAAVFAFGSKYLNENQLEKLKEVLKMSDLAVMFIEEAIEEGMQKERTEIAKDLLKEGATPEFVAKITKLTLQKVMELQSEPDNNQ